MQDFAVVGSGIGGSCSALMLAQNYRVKLFEKDQNLGGCAATFKHKGSYYNCAATTFAGYKKGNFVYEFFNKHKINFKSQPLDSALTIYQNGQFFKRHKDLDQFCNEINKVHYHPKNREFYTLIHQINETFYAMDGHYYSNASIWKKMLSLRSFFPLLLRYKSYLFYDAKTFLQNYFDGLSSDYLDFFDNQLLIVAQAKSDQVNVLTLALALGYQFQDNHYIYGGMGALIDAVTQDLDVERKCEIEKIERYKNYFALHSKNRSFLSKNVVLNCTLFDAPKLFDDPKIEGFFNKYKGFDSYKSAFMLYLQIDSAKEFDHHYQIINKKPFIHSISNSIFVSFGAKDDEKLEKSVTISIHVDKRVWQQGYERKKEALTQEILQCLQETLQITKKQITASFSAKPYTFQRFINRSTLGGIPIKKHNLVYKLPGNDTPIQGLYMVGDTTYAAQGWPGVLMGVNNLQRLVCKR